MSLKMLSYGPPFSMIFDTFFGTFVQNWLKGSRARPKGVKRHQNKFPRSLKWRPGVPNWSPKVPQSTKKTKKCSRGCRARPKVSKRHQNGVPRSPEWRPGVPNWSPKVPQSWGSNKEGPGVTLRIFWTYRKFINILISNTTKQYAIIVTLNVQTRTHMHQIVALYILSLLGLCIVS